MLEPCVRDLIVSPEGEVWEVLTKSPPLVTARRRRGTSLIILRHAERTTGGRAYQILLEELEEGGFRSRELGE